MKILITLFFSISVCFAQQISPIKAGDSAKHSGFLVDKAFAEKATSNDQKISILTDKNAALKALGQVNDERALMYKKRAEKAEIKATWSGFGGFLLGVLATGLASYAAIKVAK